MKYSVLSILIFLLCRGFLAGQTFSGMVHEKSPDGKFPPLPFANLTWVGTGIVSSSNETGHFTIQLPDSFPARLVISMVGYVSDTLIYSKPPEKPLHHVLRSVNVLNTVDIVEDKDATFISYAPIRTENITSLELKKAACCNLGESFETNATVDITYKDAITGAREIQVLGLSGSYTYLLVENGPLLLGLAQTYGLNSIPGSQIDNISIVKGPGSVIFGHDAIASMVNVDLKDPFTEEKVFVNAYIDNQLRKEINVDAKWKVNENLSTLMMVHADHSNFKFDNNKDGFMDMPMLTSVSLLNKWKFLNKKGVISQNYIKYLHEDRMSGQMAFDFGNGHDFTQNVFGQELNARMLEFNGRTGFSLKSKKYQSLGFQYSGFAHYQTGFYGHRNYNGEQHNMNLRAIYNIAWNKFNDLNLGLTWRFDETREKFGNFLLNRYENSPGFFAENTFNKDQILALIAGFRADWFNGRMYYTPRVSLKYALDENTDFRASAGTGWRYPWILAENSNVMVSSRKIFIQPGLLPEEALNTGANFVKRFKLWYRKGSFLMDFYRTDFRNMVIPDYDFDSREVHFENWKGSAFSNAFQVELTYEIIKNLDMKLAYKYLDVRKIKDGVSNQLPFIPKHRTLATFFYETFNRKWNMTFTTQWYGVKRLPATVMNPVSYQKPLYSDSYFKLNFQINRIFKKHEFYLGAENLLNFIQTDAIVAADDPFGPYFDTSFVWGPVDGRKIYLGWRYVFK